MIRLENLRKARNLSQEQLAQKLNMKQQRISSYEKGKREPDLETLKIFADFFNVSTDYLLGKTDKRNIEDTFTFAFHKESEGLSDEDIKDALRMYKQIKKNIENKEKK